MNASEPIMDLLQQHLLDLLYELRDADARIMLGGGYGLFLKRQHLHAIEARTLFTEYPLPRSTNDLYIFLKTEVLADAVLVRRIVEALNALDYKVIETKKFYQFVKKIPELIEPDGIKIDLLTRYPPPSYLESRRVRIGDARRVKPGKSGLGLHAHQTDEAVAIEDAPIEITLSGMRTTGEQCSAVILLPQAFPYLMMKLFAFRDQKYDPGKRGYGRHHALDLYTIVAMLTREEYDIAKELSKKYAQEATVQEAAVIVRDDFANSETIGSLRLREHPHYTDQMHLKEFLSILAELFPSAGEPRKQDA